MTDAPDAIHRVAVVINQRGFTPGPRRLSPGSRAQFDAEVTVATTAEEVSALSIMGMLMLGASTGTELQFNSRGSDAKDAVEALVRLVESGFEEE